MDPDTRLILCRNGAVVLQLPGFAGKYTDPAAAAEDLHAYLGGEDPSGWDGKSEWAAGLNPSFDQVRSGLHQLLDLDSILALVEAINPEGEMPDGLIKSRRLYSFVMRLWYLQRGR